MEDYTGYTAEIYAGDDSPSANAKGERMKNKFAGSDYQLIEGSPCGICSSVDGRSAEIAESIKDWINGEG